MTTDTGTRHDIRTTAPQGVPESAGWVEGVLVLLRRWVALAVGIALGLVVAAAYLATRSTTYSATAQVSVRNVIENPFAAGQNLTTSVSMATERSIALSTSAAESVQSTTGTSLTTKQLLAGVTVQNPPNSLILTFSYTSSDAQQAIRLTNAFARSYLAVRRAAVQASIGTSTKSLNDRVTVLQGRMANFTKQLKSSTGTDRTVLLLEQSSVSAQLTTVQSQLDSLAATDTSPGSVIAKASNATNGNSSSVLVTALGLIGGLVLGIALCRFREATDRRVRSAAVVEATIGAPVLNDRALRFRSASWRRDTAEVYRSMAVLLIHRLAEYGVVDAQKVVVLSARAGEGRTTLATRLAIALTETGRRVLAVSADLVEPQLARRLGGSDDRGLVQALRQTARSRPAPSGGRPSAVLDLVQEVPGRADLRLLGSGIAGSKRSEIVPRLAAVPRLISQTLRFDEIALVDTAPVFEVADTVALVDGMDAAVVVCVYGRTTKADLRRLAETAASIGVPIVGVVVFRPDTKPASWLASAPASGPSNGTSTQGRKNGPVEAAPARSDGSGRPFPNDDRRTVAIEAPASATMSDPDASGTLATHQSDDRVDGGLSDVGLADIEPDEGPSDPGTDDELPAAAAQDDAPVGESSETQVPEFEPTELGESEPGKSAAESSADESANDESVVAEASGAEPTRSVTAGDPSGGSQSGYVVSRNRVRTRNRTRNRKQPIGVRSASNDPAGDADAEQADSAAAQRVEVNS